MKLKDLLEMSNGTLIGNADLEIEIKNFSIDSRNVGEACIFVPLKGEKADGHIYIDSAFSNGAIGTFTSRDLEPIEGKILIKVDDVLKALQETAKNLRTELIDIPVVALTGSVGKTTTKDMIHAVLSKKYNTLKTQGNFNNGIGLPLTLLSYKDEEMMVLEMGMNSFGEISLLSDIARPDLSLITNVGHSHIGNLGSRENILKAKLEILEGMQEGAPVLFNGDDDMLATVENIEQEVVEFSISNEDADVFAYDIDIDDFTTSFSVKENEKEYRVKINLSGTKFVHNALAAWTIGKMYDVSPEDRVEALANCEYTKMRMNIKKTDKYTIINDCYNASSESMAVALEMLARQSGRRVAVLGEICELGEFAEQIHLEVGGKVALSRVDVLILSGDHAAAIKEGALKHKMPAENIHIFKDAADIVQNIFEIIQENDAILVKASRVMEYEKIVSALENKKA